MMTSPGRPSVPPRGGAGRPTCGLWVGAGWLGPGWAGFVAVVPGGVCRQRLWEAGRLLRRQLAGPRVWGLVLGPPCPWLSAEVTAPRPHEQPWGRRRGCEELPRPAGRTKRRSPGGLLVETALLETGLRDSDMQTGACEPRPPPPGQSVRLERVLTWPPTLLSSNAENLEPGLQN